MRTHVADSRLAASRTKSIRRDMLWLLSISSAKVAGRSSRRARSSVCGTPSSRTVKFCASRLRTNRPVLSWTEASSSTRVTSVASVTSSGLSAIVSLAVLPRLSATATVISRGSNGFSSTHSTRTAGRPRSVDSSLPSTKNWTGERTASGSALICATIRTVPGTPVRPSGEVIRTVSGRPVLAGVRCGESVRTNRAAASRARPRREPLVIALFVVSGVDDRGFTLVDEVAGARRVEQFTGELRAARRDSPPATAPGRSGRAADSRAARSSAARSTLWSRCSTIAAVERRSSAPGSSSRRSG